MPSSTAVLLVHPDTSRYALLQERLSRAGRRVQRVASAAEAKALLGRERFEVALIDLPETDASVEALLREQCGGELTAAIVAVDEGSEGATIRRVGSAEPLLRPWSPLAVELAIERALELLRLRRRGRVHQREARAGDPDPRSTATSPVMRAALELAARCAKTSTSAALLVGEGGVGKDVVAAFLHRESARATSPLVRFDARATPAASHEVELFGNAKSIGLLAAADGGTLLIDEVSALSPAAQAKLLVAIETRSFLPSGVAREVAADVRILAATRTDLASAIQRGALRAELYYRLSTMVIEVPPLRDRREDIPALARAALAAAHRATGRGPTRLAADAVEALVSHDWPGNVRELQHAMERVAMLVEGEVVTRGDLDRFGVIVLGDRRLPAASRPIDAIGLPPVGIARWPSTSLLDVDDAKIVHSRSTNGHVDTEGALANGAETNGHHAASLESVARAASEEAERRHIATVLARTSGNRTRAAELLGVSRSTLWQKLRRYNLENGA